MAYETHKETSLAGQTSVTVLIGVHETQSLNHAPAVTGHSFDRLVQIAAEESALNYARDNRLL